MKYERVTTISIIFISLVHVIGFINLRRWMEFSGIGNEATRIEMNYGFIGLVILNTGAAISFLVLAYIYHYRHRNRYLLIMAKTIVAVFLIRGIGGFVLLGLGITESATMFWEVVFSLASTGVGFVGYKGLAELD